MAKNLQELLDEKGEYALSFRYDCEQTSQVWSSMP